MRSNKDRKLNLGTAFRLTIMNQFVKKNLDVKIHKLCNLANTEETQCTVSSFLSLSLVFFLNAEFNGKRHRNNGKIFFNIISKNN